MLGEQWKSETPKIHIDDLILDFDNPRIDTGQKLSFEEVIKELYEEDVFELAKKISNNGYAANVVLMVIHESGKYIVIDGNRRALAVKLLNDPKIIKQHITPSKYLEVEKLSLTALEKDISSLKAVVYPNRASAEQDMAIQHLDGVPILQWKPLRQYRFFQNKISAKGLNIDSLAEEMRLDRKKIKNGLITLQLYEIAKSELNLDKDLFQKIFKDDKSFKSDKLQRLVVNNTKGMRFLGCSFNEDTMKIEATENGNEFFYVRLEAVLEEIYNPQSEYLSSAQFTIKDALNFFLSIDPLFLSSNAHGKGKKTKSDSNSKQSDFFTNNNDNASNFDGASKNNQNGHSNHEDKNNSSNRSNKRPVGLFFPSQVPFKLNNKSLRVLYDELKTISLITHPNAAHDLLRSFLECSLVEFLTEKGDYNKILKNKDHTPKLSELLSYIIDNRIIDDLHVIDNLDSIKRNWDKPYSLNRMNQVNHNKNYSSTEKDVRCAWNKLEPLFIVILNPKSS